MEHQCGAWSFLVAAGLRAWAWPGGRGHAETDHVFSVTGSHFRVAPAVVPLLCPPPATSHGPQPHQPGLKA